MIYLFLFFGLFFGLNLVSANLIIFLVLSLGGLVFSYRRFDKKTAFGFLIALLVGVGLSYFSLKLNANNGIYRAIVIESRANYYIVWSKFERLIVYENAQSHEVGDIIKITGSISDLVDTSLESEFNFTEFLANKGVSRQIFVSSSESIFANFIRLNAYKKMFLNLFDEGARDYIDIFLFNVKNYENASIALASSLNITYLLSTSGVFLTVLFSALEYLFFLKFDRKKSRILTLLILSWYLIFTLNRVGVRRILYIKVFSLINEYKLKKRFTYLEVLLLVGLGMLTLNHYLARQSSFYLGFFLSLVLTFTRSTLNRGKRWRLVSKTSVFVFLFMLPVSLSSNHEFHVLALLFQVILLPLTFFYSLSGVISFYSYPIRPYFNFLAKGLDATLRGLSYIDLTINFKSVSNLYIALYYVVLLAIVYFLEAYYYKPMRIMTCALLILFVVPALPYEYIYADSITFLNVGQGDSCLVRHRNKTIMIDTGGLTYKDIATECTIPYLRSKGIYHLDYVFISHSDSDHTGALKSLKENFTVREVIDEQTPFKITIDDLTISNINEWASVCADENDKSQVLTLKAANRNILMMGDASSTIENYIMHTYTRDAFNIDILKLGHHGSKTSSSYAFLDFIQPKEAIISVGRNNKYHHPNDEVLNNLKSLKIPYYRTDEVGSITYYGNNFFRA